MKALRNDIVKGLILLISFMDIDLYPQGFEAGLTLLVDLC